MIRLSLLVFLVISAPTALSVESSATGPLHEALLSQLEEYLEACRDRDGATASNLISQNTIEYYETLRMLALYADRSELWSEPLFDRFQVIIIRGTLSPETIRSEDGRGLFRRLVKAGAISGRPIDRSLIGAARLDERGRAALPFPVMEDGSTPLFLSFERRADDWMLDVAHMRTYYEATKQKELEATGRDIDEYLRNVVRIQFGDIDYEKLWEPVQSR